jgi:adenine-specific DNA methylase
MQIEHQTFQSFPQTRYQGSKLKLLPWISDCLSSHNLNYQTVLDAFSGTGSVSYLFKTLNKTVISNDIMPCNYYTSKAFIQNNDILLTQEDIRFLLQKHSISYNHFIANTFQNIYYTDEENQWLDMVTQNIFNLDCEYKKSIAFWALFQSCIIKRPYNLFHRKNLHIRTANVQRSFGNKTTWDKPFEHFFQKFILEANQAIFSNSYSHQAYCQDILHLSIPKPDLVYIDSPYIPQKGSKTTYHDFYHFLNGLTNYYHWKQQIDYSSKNLKLISPYSIWEDKKNIIVEHNLYSDTIQPISFQPSLKYCPGGDQFLFINHLGIVSPCTWISDEFPEFHHLSLSDFSLEEIFQHFTFQKFIQLKHQKINQCFLQYYQKEPLFQKLYAFSTENLHYLSQLPIKNKSHALTITGSGDQALELILLGFKNIYLIDIQPFSQYFAELKFIAIQHLSLQEFKKFFYISEQSFSYHSYQKLRQFLSPICESFWNIEYQKHQFNGYLLRTSSLFKTEYEKQSQHEKNIPYLTNPSQYLFLQEALEKVSIEFLTGDYQTYSFKQKYDCILLSNIADYSHKIFPINSIQNFKTYFVQKSFSHLNEQGFLMFAYIYDYENQHNSHLRNPINSLEQRKSFFSDLEYQELLIKSAIENLQHDIVCYLSSISV